MSCVCVCYFWLIATQCDEFMKAHFEGIKQRFVVNHLCDVISLTKVYGRAICTP